MGQRKTSAERERDQGGALESSGAGGLLKHSEHKRSQKKGAKTGGRNRTGRRGVRQRRAVLRQCGGQRRQFLFTEGKWSLRLLRGGEKAAVRGARRPGREPGDNGL